LVFAYYSRKPEHDIVSFPVVIILFFTGICFWKVKKTLRIFSSAYLAEWLCACFWKG